MSKMKYIEKKFKEAKNFLRNTGAGLTSFDEKMGVSNIRQKLLIICPFYFQVKPFMSESVSVNPPYIGESGLNENFSKMLFGTCFGEGRGLHGSIAEDGIDVHSKDEISSGEEELDFEELSAQQEPNQEDLSQGILATPTATQSRSTPNRQERERKKKPKPFQESVQNIQNQNRVLMEKKLQLQVLHHDQKYIFLREDLKMKHDLETRRLDLEFIRMEQEREGRQEERDLQRQEREQQREQYRQESCIREVALQVELAKLRGNS